MRRTGPMQCSHGILQELFRLAAVCAALGFAGCGNSCFVGFSNNGSGGIIVKTGNPPPVCTLNQAQGMVRVTLEKSPVCMNCAAAMRLEHIYVLLRSVQIQAEARGETGPLHWVELGPELTAQPRRIDLIGDSRAELLVANSEAPADKYSLLRLQFASEAESVDSDCGGFTNCIVMADGRIEPVQFAGELEFRTAPDSGSLFVLPESVSEVHLWLIPQSVGEIFAATADRPQTRVAGEFRVFRED